MDAFRLGRTSDLKLTRLIYPTSFKNSLVSRSAVGKALNIAEILLDLSLGTKSTCAECNPYVARPGYVLGAATNKVFHLFLVLFLSGGLAVFAKVAPRDYCTHLFFFFGG